MSSLSSSAIKLVDRDGENIDDGDGKLNVNATLVAGATIDIGDVEILGHGAITHIARNVTDSAVQLGSVACKHADIMANISNTGIGLYAGDVYSVDISNTNLLYVISTVSGDDINIVTYN